jgi:hypothetical protein
VKGAPSRVIVNGQVRFADGKLSVERGAVASSRASRAARARRIPSASRDGPHRLKRGARLMRSARLSLSNSLGDSLQIRLGASRFKLRCA